MTKTFTAKYDASAVVLNGMDFGLHAIATVSEKSDNAYTVSGDVVISIHRKGEITGLTARFHVSSDEARRLADALNQFASLAEAKCADLAVGEAA